MTPTLGKTNPGVQALRALACLLVIYQHATYFACVVKGIDYQPFLPINYGRIGVCLFFLISGHVMGNCLDQGHGFLWQRIKRIYPPFWIAIALTGVILIGAGTEWHLTWKSVLLIPVTLKDANESYRIPYWTLVYEMAFYVLTYVFILLKLSRKSISTSCLIWIVLILVKEAYRSTGEIDSPEGFPNIALPGWWIYLSPMSIFFAVGLFGSTVGRSERVDEISTPMLAVGGLALWAAGNWMKAPTPAPSFLVSALAYWCLLEIARRTSVPNLLKRLGDFSYGAYLIHMSVMVAVLTAIQKSQTQPRFIVIWVLIFGTALVVANAFGAFEYFLHRRFFNRKRVRS